MMMFADCGDRELIDGILDCVAGGTTFSHIDFSSSEHLSFAKVDQSKETS